MCISSLFYVFFLFSRYFVGNGKSAKYGDIKTISDILYRSIIQVKFIKTQRLYEKQFIIMSENQ